MAELSSASLVFATIFLLLLSCHPSSSLVSPTSTTTFTFLSTHNNETDHQSLISFKSMISSDPRGQLASWNDSIHFCRWPGVTCGGRQHPPRVVSLNLSSLDLAGLISPTIANLTSLQMIDLSDNQFYGSIPQDIKHLLRLQLLNLSINSLEGGIPTSLANLSSLSILDLQHNNINGSIPPTMGNVSSLIVFSVAVNQLSGGIPPSLGKLSKLKELYLASNYFSGVIPPSLGGLSKLKKLQLSNNSFSGIIPPSLYNLSSLSHLFLTYNPLSGSLPPNIGQALPLLEQIALGGNQFQGPIPISLSNASRLQFIYLYENRFTGIIPPNLGSLQNLQRFVVYSNHLEAAEPDEWSFLTALTNCTLLEQLDVGLNNLSGILPNSVANLSTSLKLLAMDANLISGKISPGIGNLVNLRTLGIWQNFLTATIPASIGMLQKLHILDLSCNMLSGEIPSTFANLTQLIELYLQVNELCGNIPAGLGNFQNLDLLHLGDNKITGKIPKEVLTISTLSKGLYLPFNSLTGSIPVEVGNLRNLGLLDVSMNKLSGNIPSTLGECQVLEELYLGGNFLHGSIPSSLASLKGILKLDVSKNNLSGNIPDFLQELRGLNYLNLSFNNFEGEVPRLGVFENVSAVLVIGNNKLCGGNPKMHLPACPSQILNKKHDSHTLGLVIGITSSFIFLVLLSCYLIVRCWRRGSKRKPHDSTPIKEQHVKVTYAELVKATNGFSSDNIIGDGSFGTVYRGILDEDSTQVVAVKVLNLQVRGASKSFMAECEALRNIRHRNLLKILTICSSLDCRGNDFKAVVFEFMAKGNLDDWLHPKENEQSGQKKLNLMQRLNIAIDVASALDYLHHQGDIPIIHCDLKPSNILLDDDMTPHVGDFGLAKFFKKIDIKSSQHSISSVGLKGTVGYIAPEYGMANEVSTRGDVYSFGVLLLEMFTGMRPTADTFIGGLSLPMFVEMAFPERITDVIDSHLLLEEDGEASDCPQKLTGTARAIECIASVLRIGISCSNEVPAERMEMGEVIRKLHKMKDTFLRNETRG